MRPASTPNFLSDPYDRHVAAEMFRLTRGIVAQASLAPYTPEEHVPGL